MSCLGVLIIIVQNDHKKGENGYNSNHENSDKVCKSPYSINRMQKYDLKSCM